MKKLLLLLALMTYVIGTNASTEFTFVLDNFTNMGVADHSTYIRYNFEGNWSYTGRSGTSYPRLSTTSVGTFYIRGLNVNGTYKTSDGMQQIQSKGSSSYIYFANINPSIDMELNDLTYDHYGYVKKIVIYWKEAHSVSECVGTMTNGTIKNIDNKTWEYVPSNVTTVHPDNFSIYFSDATKDKDFTLQKVEITKLLPDYWILSSTKTEFTHTYDGTGGTENYGKYIVAKDYKTGLSGQNYSITSTYFSNQGSNGPIATLVNANTKVVNASQGASSSYVWKNIGTATITVSPANDQYYTVFIIGQPKIYVTVNQGTTTVTGTGQNTSLPVSSTLVGHFTITNRDGRTPTFSLTSTPSGATASFTTQYNSSKGYYEVYLTADKLGNYTFSCSVAENKQWTAATGTFTMTVNKGTTVINPNLWDRQTDGNGKLTNTQIGYFVIKELDGRTPTITMTSYPSGANASFTYQLVNSSSNSYAVYLTTDKEGDYTFSCSVTDNGRWTAATSTKTIKVTSLTPDVKWYEGQTLKDVYDEWGNLHEMSAGTGAAVETDRNYAEGYNTFCTAFNIPRDEFEYIFGSDVKVYTFQWATKDRIMHFRPYSGDLKENEPYLLYLSHAVPAPIYNVAEWMKTEYWDSGNGNIIGSVSHTDEEGNTYYYIGHAAFGALDDMLPSGKTYKNVRFITAGGHELLTPTATGNLKGWRCVFVYPDKEATAGASAREFVSFDDDETTGISSIYSLDELNIDADDNTPEYNTAGQRVGKGYRGIVIRNGRKYLKR